MGRDMPPDGGLAREAYEAYGDAVGWRNYIGIPMPPWHQLTEAVQNGWRAAAAKVAAAGQVAENTGATVAGFKDRFLGSGTGPVETRTDTGAVRSERPPELGAVAYGAAETGALRDLVSEILDRYVPIGDANSHCGTATTTQIAEWRKRAGT